MTKKKCNVTTPGTFAYVWERKNFKDKEGCIIILLVSLYFYKQAIIHNHPKEKKMKKKSTATATSTSTDTTPTIGKPDAKTKAVSKSKRAGLIFPVGRFAGLMKRRDKAMRVGASAPVYLAGVLEFLCMDLLSCAGDRTKEIKRLTITPKSLQTVFETDDEWNLMNPGHVVFDGAGVFPAETGLINQERARVRRIKEKKKKAATASTTKA